MHLWKRGIAGKKFLRKFPSFPEVIVRRTTITRMRRGLISRIFAVLFSEHLTRIKINWEFLRCSALLFSGPLSLNHLIVGGGGSYLPFLLTSSFDLKGTTIHLFIIRNHLPPCFFFSRFSPYSVKLKRLHSYSCFQKFWPPQLDNCHSDAAGPLFSFLCHLVCSATIYSEKQCKLHIIDFLRNM